MGMKEFFKISKEKIMLSLILIVIFPAISMNTPQCMIGGDCPTSYDLVFFSLPIQIDNYYFIYFSKSQVFHFPLYSLQLLVNLFISYSLSSLIINKIKNKQK